MKAQVNFDSLGNSIPASDNITYAYKGTATLTGNQVSEFSDAPIYNINVGDGSMFILKGQTPFRVYMSETEYYDSINGMVTYWNDSAVAADTGKPSYYTTVTQQYELATMLWKNN